MAVLTSEIEVGATATAYPAMVLLRPALASEAEFVRRVDDVQRAEGYRLVGVFTDSSPVAQAVAGFRILNTLYAGRCLFVDELSTLDTARRQGHARRLLDWLDDEARRLTCREVHLDSAVGPTRSDAHRLYLNAGMVIAAHHFTKSVEPL